jgi:hypothetical protein
MGKSLYHIHSDMAVAALICIFSNVCHQHFTRAATPRREGTQNSISFTKVGSDPNNKDIKYFITDGTVSSMFTATELSLRH